MKKLVLLLLCFSCTLSSFAQWTPKASFPGAARHHPVNFTLNGQGYLMAGSSNNFFAMSDVYRYTPASDSWEVMPSFPGMARGFSYGFEMNGKAYIGFGLGSNNAPLNDLWEYDPNTEVWTELAPCGCEARLHPAFLNVGGKIYVGTGSGGGNKTDWWEYDPASNTWEEKASLPGPARHHPYYFGIEPYAYVGFGHGNGIFNDFYRYDPSTDEWTQLDDFPGEGRVAGTQFSFEGKGYVLSGQGEDHENFDEGQFWEFDPVLETWTSLDVHPGSGRWAPGSFVIDNYVYFMAGEADEGFKNDMMAYALSPDASINHPFQDWLANVKISPNPIFNGSFTLPNSELIRTIKTTNLIDIKGRSVATVNQQNNRFSFDQSSVLPGVYFLEFTLDDHNAFSKKIVVQ